MSSFFSTLSALAFLAMIVFIIQARRKRPGASKRAWQAVAAVIVFSAISSATMTAAEKQVAEAKRVAEAQQVAAAAAQQRTADAKAATARAAQDAAEERAAAIKKANTSIEPAEMIVACQRQARERLKLPDTARFPGFLEGMDNQPLVGPVGAMWRSWVESENSFGGTVRTQFKCQYVKKDNTLYLDFLDN
ncbi:hypothetical protein GCM10022631_12150 [Deinococcus rubellus]|uniref:Uncharacterized protein n=1 Tax=Deinococcus rubellus TaxID=1889240 RepID=A0ABY5YEM1_9DEIO|nr:hypothetical protein [Deinococcus rubellus]UWX62739.1 hypothetical protein N0D28_08130 [Deinococcus rubellus]